MNSAFAIILGVFLLSSTSYVACVFSNQEIIHRRSVESCDIRFDLIM